MSLARTSQCSQDQQTQDVRSHPLQASKGQRLDGTMGALKLQGHGRSMTNRVSSKQKLSRRAICTFHARNLRPKVNPIKRLCTTCCHAGVTDAVSRIEWSVQLTINRVALVQFRQI